MYTYNLQITVGEPMYAKIEKAAMVVKEIFPCDMRAGKIVSLEEHPAQDTLYVVKVCLQMYICVYMYFLYLTRVHLSVYIYFLYITRVHIFEFT